MKYNVTKAVRKYTKGRKIKATNKSIANLVSEIVSDRLDWVAKEVIRVSTPFNESLESSFKLYGLCGKFFIHNNARRVLLRNTTYMMFTGASPIVQATVYAMQRYGLELVASVLAYNANKKVDEYVEEVLIGKIREFVLAADDWAHTWLQDSERMSFKHGTEY